MLGGRHRDRPDTGPVGVMIGGMLRLVLVPTAVFAVLVFVGFLLLSGSSVAESLVKALVVAVVFGLIQWWLVRRRTKG
jgi:hypothetical protein